MKVAIEVVAEYSLKEVIKEVVEKADKAVSFSETSICQVGLSSEEEVMVPKSI